MKEVFSAVSIVRKGAESDNSYCVRDGCGCIWVTFNVTSTSAFTREQNSWGINSDT